MTDPKPVPPCAATCALRLLAVPGFDWPCACGHTSDQCSKRSDGKCDG